MTDKSSFLQPKHISPAEQLRAQLTTLENDAATLAKMTRAEALAYLGTLDAARDGLARLTAAGNDLSAELVRFDDLQARITRYAEHVLRAVGGGAALRAARPANVMRASHPWWFADEIAAEAKARARKRVFTILGVATAVLLAVVLAFNTILKPDPVVLAKTRHFQRAMALAAEQQNHLAALDEVEAILSLTPDDVDALAFKGVLLVKMGNAAAGESVSAQASALAPDDAYVPLAQARLWQQLGNPAEALSLAENVLATHLDSAEGWYIAGQAHAALGDTPQAREALSKAAELALAQGNDSLYVIAKTNLTYLLPGGK